MSSKIKLGVIGCGNMASAILQGHCKNSNHFDIYLYDIDPLKSQELAEKIGGSAVSFPTELSSCPFFLLAIKPQQLDVMADEFAEIIGEGAVVVSILAGANIAKIKKSLEVHRVTRVMPNTPCLYSKGVSAIYHSPDLAPFDRELVESIFSFVSTICLLQSEDDVDKISGITGSGPALLFEFTLALAAKLKSMEIAGVGDELAEKLVQETIFGSSILMNKSKDSLEQLKANVTSKGGITFEALKVFDECDLRQIISTAIDAAYGRAKEL